MPDNIIEKVRKFFRDKDENGREFGHNLQALEQLAEKFSSLVEAAKKNRAEFGGRESEAAKDALIAEDSRKIDFRKLLEQNPDEAANVQKT